MSDITVTLASTKFMRYEDFSLDSSPFIKMDVPVCIASMMIGFFGGTPQEKEVFELQWSQTCMDMAKFVIVDQDKKTVYIGDKDHLDTGALVEYTVDKPSVYSNNFFERWKETGIMIFEFTMLDFKNEPIFCLKGIWSENSWKNLEIVPSSKIKVVGNLN